MITNFEEVDDLCRKVLDAEDIVNKALAVIELIKVLDKLHEFATKYADKHPMASN